MGLTLISWKKHGMQPTQWCALEAGGATSSECTTLELSDQRWHCTSVVVDAMKEELPCLQGGNALLKQAASFCWQQGCWSTSAEC